MRACTGLFTTVAVRFLSTLLSWRKVLAEEEKDLLPQSHTAEIVAHATRSGLLSAAQTKFPIWKDGSTYQGQQGDGVAGGPCELKDLFPVMSD